MEKIRRKLLVGSLGLTFAAFSSPSAGAHRGGLNEQGCHNNRKTGDYHCHSPSTSTSGSGAALNGASLARPSPSAEQIFSAQTALMALGYDVGDVDGQPGSKTQQALKAFERSESWPAVGEVNDAAIFRLVVVLSEKKAC